MEIRRSLSEGLILLDLEAREIRSAIEQTVEELVDRGRLSAALKETVLRGLLSKEIETQTAIGRNTAVPHAFLEALTKPVLALVRLDKPIDMAAPDGNPVRYLFILLGPKNRAGEYVRILVKITRLMGDQSFRYELRTAREPKHVIEAYDRYLRRIQPSQGAATGQIQANVEPAKRPFGGIAKDAKRRLAHYRDDLKDGLHLKSVASTLFMYFACLAPAVAFGGLMSVVTEGQIGVVEMMVSTAICGVIYALTAGAPLTILAGTGPLLIFTGLLYQLCVWLELPFLSVYAWTGFWTGALLLAIAIGNACKLIRLLTRFTNEIFAALIALIFIVKALGNIVAQFRAAEASDATSHDQAFLTLMLALGTYGVANSLARFRSTPYLRLGVREFLSDFGPSIALGSMTAVALYFQSDVPLEPLPVPEQFGTTADRPWLVAFWNVPPWVPIAAIVPATLAAVLIYMNQNITTRLIDKPENQLQRGIGYHLNMAVVGLLILLCSPFALPWLMASVIPSLNHLRSLSETEDVTGPGGRARQKVVSVRENRITPLAIHVLIALSLVFVPLLRNMPMAVLFGLFLFMGVSSLTANQFWDRLRLWLTDPALYPPTHYVRKVPIPVIHKYTLIQLGALVALWLVQASPIGILFPLLVALLVPLRFWIEDRVIPRSSIAILDAVAEDPEANDPPEVDEVMASGAQPPPAAAPQPAQTTDGPRIIAPVEARTQNQKTAPQTTTNQEPKPEAEPKRGRESS